MRWFAVLLAAVLGGCAPSGIHARHIAAGGGQAEVTSPVTVVGGAVEEAAVLAAYLRSRAIDVDAFANLDPSALATVFADSALASRMNEIADRRREGRPMAVRMEYHAHVTLLAHGLAIVDDDVVNHSVRLEPVTRQPLEADPNELLQDTYTLERREGRWLVVLTARVAS